MTTETLVLNPVEFTPDLPEIDLNDLGLSVAANPGPDYGESSVTVDRVRKAISEGVTDARWPPVECTVPLIARATPTSPIADPLHRLEAWVADVQRRHVGWIRRDFDAGAGVAGSVGCFVDSAGLTPAQSWMFAHNQIEPNLILKFSRYPIWYAAVEEEFAEVKGVSVRDLQIELSELLGTAPGLISIRLKNEGAEDWRGCIVSIECDDFSSAPTAEPKYEARELTMKGGSEVTAATPPVVRAVGGVAAGTGAISPGLPAGTVAGDLLVMVAESGGATAEAEANAPLTATGWTEAPLGSQKQGNTRLTVLYKIAAGGDATTTNDTGDHQLARIIGIKAGTFDPAAPFNTSTRGTQAMTKAVSIPGAITTRGNCLVLACAAASGPDATGSAFSAAANASLTSVTERIDNVQEVGDGGAIWAVTGVRAAQGAYGTTTGTAASEAELAVISLAVNPLPEYVKCPPLTAGWQTVLSSEIEGVGHMTHIGARRMLFGVNDLSAVLDDVQWKLEWRTLGAANWVQTMTASTPIVVSSPVIGDYQLIDLGECRPEVPITGEPRFEFRLQARSLSGSGKQPLIRDVYPSSLEQWVRVSDTSDTPIDGAPKKAPGTVEDVSHGTVSWSNPENAMTADANYASAETSSGSETKSSHYLKATNFGFAIPSDATILGINPFILRRVAEGAVALAPAVSDEHVRLVKGGTILASEDKAEPGAWTTADGYGVYGGPYDLWGNPWTPADINDPGFGVALAVVFNLVISGTLKAEVDLMGIQVCYAETANENRVCFATREMELSDTGVLRQHPEDEVWGDLDPEGMLLRAPTPGQAGQNARALIIPSVGDFDSRADSAATKLTASGSYRPGYLFARESV